MVAVLMVIVAFQAGINTPGGVWQDTGFHNATKLSSNFPQSSPPKLVRHYAGQSVMSFADPKRYEDFFMFNIITLASSMLVVILLLSKRLINSCSRIFDAFATILTLVSILAMSANYGVSLSFILFYIPGELLWSFSLGKISVHPHGGIISGGAIIYGECS